MKIDEAQVEYVANLARIALSEEEKRMFAEQLGKIIEYVEKLNELDTSRVDPLYRVIEMGNVLREDEVKSSISQKDALSNAPNRFENFFTVPKVLD